MSCTPRLVRAASLPENSSEMGHISRGVQHRSALRNHRTCYMISGIAKPVVASTAGPYCAVDNGMAATDGGGDRAVSYTLQIKRYMLSASLQIE